MSRDFNDVVVEFDGGVFVNKISATLAEVASAVVNHDKPGELNIKLQLKKIGDSNQVKVDHTVIKKKPTARGTQTEDNKTTTPMHVGRKGQLSLFPETEIDIDQYMGGDQ